MEMLEKVYDPKKAEDKWYKEWRVGGYFHAEDESDKSPFSIVIPPPNVTGSLHMGHALNMTLQDISTRYHRMAGYNACWMPGTDHAGIATQNVVEKQLAAEGIDRHKLGREKFIERTWQWKKEYGNRIVHQLKRLGCSCDWERERFTMDEGLSRAVKEVFVELYKEGLIYRGEYLVNWCPRCHTAISDLEVDYEEKLGSFWYIRYPFKEGVGEVVVATTRPETMLGDTAVAVNPSDERYKEMVGESIILPLVDREIPIIADHRVDMEFGTGVVKITPAHDPNDFLMGNEHSLKRINILTPDAKINENGIHFKGQERFECRKNIIKELEEKGYLVKITDHLHNIGHCYRCKTIIEPYLSKQWFVKVAPLAKEAIKAVKKGKTKFIPENWTKTYFEWMENIQDWCISRQIWWGHRIPAWYCRKRSSESLQEIKESEECPPIVSKEKPESCPHCGNKDLKQETDVLDTWFSSSLWPFSTWGWPDETKALKTFYPTTVLITGFDIIFFWVARMMMMGLKFMNEVPFKDVYIHALVRDEKGQKMSKSKGNVVDPLMVMDKHGTDAFRFTMAALAAQGRDIKMSEDRVEGYRNFCNKIWNAARFVMMNLEDFEYIKIDKLELSLSNKWILNRLQEVTNQVIDALENYQFDLAARSLYQFIWHEFCDWYLELSKIYLNEDKNSEFKKTAKNVLFHVLNSSLKLLHPFTPFVTEEIWQKLQTLSGIKKEAESIMISKYPSKSTPKFQEDAEQMEELMSIITAIRNIRGEHTVSPSKKIKAIIVSGKKKSRNIVENYREILMTQAGLEDLELLSKSEPIKKAAASVAGDFEIFVPFKGLINIDEEIQRLKKEISKSDANVKRLQSKLSNKKFISNAPKEIVEKEKRRLEEAEEEMKKLEKALLQLREG